MSNTLVSLKPEAIWRNFEKLTQIPRPSKKEGKIIKFMQEFGENLGLETVTDKAGNVVIRKPATEGMEDRKMITLQSHLDMVCQKNNDKEFDFENDPIETLIEGEWVTANGTTLGSDNGMGVAAAMSVLEADDIKHGPIEALFTIDEETGMTGAFALQPGFLQGEILMNLDSEDEGELYIGCAGGVDTIVKMQYQEVAPPAGHAGYKISLGGLKGGHSGMEIDTGRGNANKLMNRLLYQLYKEFDVRISSINGGGLRNAIPRESVAMVTVPENKKDEFLNHISEYEQVVQNELGKADPGLKITATESQIIQKVMEHKNQNDLIKGVYGCPNGVIMMSRDVKGLVETSTNLARVEVKDGSVEIQSLQRSSEDSAKEDLAAMIRCVFELAGGQVMHEGSYPGWKPDPDSNILSSMKKVYEKMYSKVPEVKAVHAGLECGIIGSKYPELDMISFGPTIRNPHSPDEKVNIPTVEKFWDYLVESLESAPRK